MENKNQPSNDQPIEPNLEIVESGLHCDNPKCDWDDKTITFENYKSWLNKPCPKCGENVLTQQDYINAETIRLTANFVNSMSKEELDELAKLAEGNLAEIFKGVKGVDTLKPDGEVVMTISTHKEIKVEEIKNAE